MADDVAVGLIGGIAGRFGGVRYGGPDDRLNLAPGLLQDAVGVVLCLGAHDSADDIGSCAALNHASADGIAH
ncbi:hypothetical protein D3C84_1209350 [compost metagenome]